MAARLIGAGMRVGAKSERGSALIVLSAEDPDVSVLSDRATSDACTVLEPGTLVADRYRIESCLGIGGQGAVHRATHVALGLPVAVKTLDLARLEGSAEQTFERFAREARTIARIRHRNVVAIHDAGYLDSGSPYLVTELIEGENLEQHLTRGPMSVPAVVDLGRQLFAALTALAENELIHRDVKPANVMLHREGDAHVQITLIDFGIARAARELGRLTVTGQIVGTPHYMSPEQLRGEPADRSTDSYAASVLLYEALTGRPPFDGPTAPLVIGAILAGDFEPIRKLRPDCPAALAELVERGISTRASDRPSHPSVVADRLERIVRTLGLPTGSMAWAEDASFAETMPIELVRARERDVVIDEPTAERTVAPRSISHRLARLARGVVLVASVLAIGIALANVPEATLVGAWQHLSEAAAPILELRALR